METKDYTKVTSVELLKHIEEGRRDLQKLTFQIRSNQLKNVRALRLKRKELARLNTALRGKQA